MTSIFPPIISDPTIQREGSPGSEDSGYQLGSIWVDEVTEIPYCLVNNTPGNARWVNIAQGGTGTSDHLGLTNLDAGVYGTGNHTNMAQRISTNRDPGVNDDAVNTGGIGVNLLIGTVWVNTDTDIVYILADNTTGAAVWVNVTSGGGAGDMTKAVYDPANKEEQVLTNSDLSSNDGYIVENDEPYFGTKDYFVNFEAVVANPDGSFYNPYSSIQDCLNAIGPPVDSADARQKITIHIKAGQYDENVIIPKQRMITFLCYGTVIIGDGASDIYNSTIPRSVTVNNTATGEPAEAPSRPAFNIKGVSGETSSTHAAYGTGNMIISGDLNFNHEDGNTTSHETYLCGVKVQGDVLANASELGSVHNIQIEKCFFDRSFNLPNVNINIARSTEFDGLITATGVGRFIECQIQGGITASQVNYYPPKGFYNCTVDGGTLTISNMFVDAVTRQSIEDNAITVIGSLENAEPYVPDDLSGAGNPNGIVAGIENQTYLDTENGIFYKCRLAGQNSWFVI